jgi:DNA-binding MurR/RpiR family transcriptional regulator
MTKIKRTKNTNITRVDVLSAIQNASIVFSAPELRCANAILDFPELVSHESITEFAGRAQTSQATVVRFCKKVGFTGYPNLRLALAATLGFRAGSSVSKGLLEFGITQGDTTTSLVEKIANSCAETIRLTSGRIDIQVIEDLLDALRKANLIASFGAGASGLVASDLRLKFNRIGKPCLYWSDNHTALNSIATLSDGDLLFIISHSGETPESIAVATEFQARGIKVVVITNSSTSTLAHLADFTLLTHAERNIVRIGATVSRIAQLYVVDCIAVAWAQRTWELSRGALTDAVAAVERQVTHKDWLYQESMTQWKTSAGKTKR